MAAKGIGDELRRERLRQGLTLDAISGRTKISLRSLEAIEADAFDRLPGLVFTRNFVRLYALDLKMEPDGLLDRLPRFNIEAAPLPDPPARTGRTQWDPRLTAALVSALWLVTAGAAGSGAWYYYNHYGRHLLTAVAAAPAPKPANPVSSVKPAAVTPAAVTPAEPPQVPSTSPATDKITPAPRSNEAPPTQAFDNSRPVQVILTARDVVWVQVSADGKTAFVGTLHPNDTRSVAADAQVKILTGNAGGLDISLNGRPLDPLGPKGQTRTVRLTAAGPQFGPQNPPVSSPL